MIIFIRLLIAHLLADFVFQTEALVRDKNRNKIKSVRLYFHALLHGALSWLFVWDASFWIYALLIAVSHFFIDLAKVYFKHPKYQREAFLFDQLAHLLILIIISSSYLDLNLALALLPSYNVLIVFFAFILFLTKPASVFIKIFISKWTPEETEKIESLESAGNWIGILERLLIFIFMISQQWEAVGFLLAAKSIFRFGDLKEANDRKLTEYILIGTLASFGLAIVVSIFYSSLLPYVS